MGLYRWMFRVLYRVGFTPWDGHGLPELLRRRVAGPDALAPGKALDCGCGTGDTSIFLARHGWDVTGIDFVERALDRARAKTQAAGLNVRYVQGSVTRLSEHAATGTALFVDNGCIHGVPDPDRAGYARELTRAASRGATLVIAGFRARLRGVGPRGIDPSDVRRLFEPDWALIADEPDQAASSRADDPLHVYELRRR